MIVRSNPEIDQQIISLRRQGTPWCRIPVLIGIEASEAWVAKRAAKLGLEVKRLPQRGKKEHWLRS